MLLRSRLYSEPDNLFLHEIVLAAARRFPNRFALIDTSCSPPRHILYEEFAEMLERTARGLVQAGVSPGDRVAIYLFNSWEFCLAFHAACLAGATPTPLNPSYREREVRYQLQNSGASALITDGKLIAGMDLGGLPDLKRVYVTREGGTGAESFASLMKMGSAALPKPEKSSRESLAVLPYSSGTTGLPKGVMLSHHNLVANVFQIIGPEAAPLGPDDVTLCFLPLYHIYGMNVVFNPVLALGGTLVLMPRFDLNLALDCVERLGITYLPLVPPVMNLFCQAAEQGRFPKNHQVRWSKCGAAPLAPDLARRYSQLTGIPVIQGYGMTEASPVTHIGFGIGPLYRPESIGQPVAQTECRIVGEAGREVAMGEPGELVMRGPQFMLGYWNAPEATREALRDGWYWSGDIARRDQNDLYFIVDRRKELIKYKGFPVAPAEVESVLLDHPAVRDCGVVGRPDTAAGEVPLAFVVLREGFLPDARLQTELCGYVGERLTGYKQPREVRFVSAIPRNPSGKILRRELRKQLE